MFGLYSSLLQSTDSYPISPIFAVRYPLSPTICSMLSVIVDFWQYIIRYGRLALDWPGIPTAESFYPVQGLTRKSTLANKYVSKQIGQKRPRSRDDNTRCSVSGCIFGICGRGGKGQHSDLFRREQMMHWSSIDVAVQTRSERFYERLASANYCSDHYSGSVWDGDVFGYLPGFRRVMCFTIPCIQLFQCFIRYSWLIVCLLSFHFVHFCSIASCHLRWIRTSIKTSKQVQRLDNFRKKNRKSLATFLSR